jgi:hypothetical protein
MKKYLLIRADKGDGPPIATVLHNCPRVGEFVMHEKKRFKVVWVLHENHVEKTHLGVIPN